MGADLSIEQKNEIREDQIKFSSLSPNNISKLKSTYLKDQNFSPDKKQFMSITGAGKRETDILFEYFDMDGNGQIDSYEFICLSAMLIHASVELRSEFLFKLYDFDNNNFLTRDEIVHLIRNVLIANRRNASSSEVERRTDELIKSADIDLDKKLSFREFQNYLFKTKDILAILDQYYILSSDKVNENNDNEENNNVEGNQFNEEELHADEMDPDLMKEFHTDEKSDEDQEAINKIKEGAEFETQTQNGLFKSEEVLQATEFSACKPWMGVVLHSVPSDYKPKKSDSFAPDNQLELEFIHGYRTHDTRNNLRYTDTGEIVYHTAAVGIIYNKEEHKQRFVFDHIDDIISLAIHPNKNIIATGEIGPYPLICIWDSNMNTKVRITGPLTKGITHLAFSPDGKYLVGTSLHDDHHIAVFDWERGANIDISEVKGKAKLSATESPVVATNKGPRANILNIAIKNNSEGALTCVKEVNFFSWSKGKLTVKKGTGMKSLQTIMCGSFVGNTLVSGAYSGELYLWSGAAFTKSVKAHANAVNCIYTRAEGNGFISGGNDGMIYIWDDKYKKISKLSILEKSISSLSPKVRSVCEGDNGNILVGTRGGEIIEFEGNNPNVLLRGHFDNELWALAMHPKKDKYFTCGQDKMLAIWDIKTRVVEKFTTVPEPVEVMCVSPDGKNLALGCKNGDLYIYDAVSLTQKAKKHDRKHPISEMKFSPDGNTLAVGGVDFLIYLYDKSFNLMKKMKGHVSRVTHMDFSDDSSVIQSNSTSYDLLYHNLDSGKQVPGGASAYKDERWNSYTCVIGWAVQGIWPPCASGDDINAVDRDKKGKIIATADDWGKVKLFKYPCPVEKSSFNRYVGHSSHVTCVRFSNSNGHLISTGGNDKAIFQWKHIADEEMENENHDIDDLEDENDVLDDDENKIDKGFGSFKEEEMGEGDEFGVSKPFLGEVRASTPKGFKPSKDAGEAPNESLKLKYVHGYRAFDTRSNVKYLGDGNVVFHAAALGINLDKNTNTQTFFDGHDEDVVCLAIHPNKNIIATGQMAKAGKAKLIDIYVWDATTKEVKANLKGFHLRAVRNLAFSPNGSKLLSGGQDDDNSIAVYDWENSKIICTSPVDKARVMDLGFSSENEFVSIGLKHIKFFSVNGRNLNVKKGIFGSIKQESLLSMCFGFSNNTLLTGDTKGNLIVWSGRNAIKSFKSHNGAVYTLYSGKNNLVYSGGEDGIIKVFTSKYEVKDTIDTTKMTPFKVGIRAIDMDDNGCMLIGTRGGDIIELTNNFKKQKTLLQSHYDTELWAVTVNPKNPTLFASGGGDCTLRVWDAIKNVMLKHCILDQDFRAIDWSSDGKFLIVGSMSGKIYYIDYESFKVVNSMQSMFKTTKQWIQELKISPDSQYVAYGAHGCVSKVEILKVNPGTSKPLQTFSVINPRFTSSLTHLDWSSDSNFIVCNSLAFELKFLNVEAKGLVNASAAVDIEWNTWTCLFGFPVQGIWPPESTGYIVNYTCKSSNGKILATGDDFSLVKLFKYPCVIEKAKYQAFKGHSSHVPKIRFSCNDQFLFSTGGNDKCVFVWETDFGSNLVENNNEDNDINDQEEEDEKPKKKSKKEKEIKEEEEEEEPEPVPKKKSNKKKIVEDDFEDENEEPEPKPEKKSKIKKQIVEEEEEVEEEPEPKPKKKSKKKKPVIEEEEEEVEEEPEPKPKKKSKKKKVIEEEDEEEEEPKPKNKKNTKKMIEDDDEDENYEDKPVTKNKKKKVEVDPDDFQDF